MFTFNGTITFGQCSFDTAKIIKYLLSATKNLLILPKIYEMIQRKQTLFMFLSAILSGLLFVLPLSTFTFGSNINVGFSILGVDIVEELEGFFSSSYTWPLVAITILMTLTPVFTALRYKHRVQQVRFSQLNMLFNMVFVGLVLLYYVSDIQKIIPSEPQYKIGVFIPLINMVLEYFAIRGVKKDIELLKSVDRLR